MRSAECERRPARPVSPAAIRHLRFEISDFRFLTFRNPKSAIRNGLAACLAVLAFVPAVARGQANFWVQTDAAASQFGTTTNPTVNVQVGNTIPLYIWFNKNSQTLGFDGVSFDVRLQSGNGGAASAAIAIDLPPGRWDGATAGVSRNDSGGTGVDDCNAFDFTNTDTLSNVPARFAALDVTGVTSGTIELFLCVGTFGIADAGANSVVRLGFAQNATSPEALNISGGVSGQCSTVAEAFITVLPALPDFDHDNDVDQGDFADFQLCLTGENNPQNDPACGKARMDADNDVDSFDFNLFAGCMAGANVTPACLP